MDICLLHHKHCANDNLVVAELLFNRNKRRSLTPVTYPRNFVNACSSVNINIRPTNKSTIKITGNVFFIQQPANFSLPQLFKFQNQTKRKKL